MKYEVLVEQLCTEKKPDRLRLTGDLQRALPESLDAVLAGLTDARPLVRSACAAVLDDSQQDERVELALRAACRDRDARVRHNALHSLGCVHCKPDGCVPSDSVDVMLDALLHDPSIRLRRKMAGEFMHRQHGAGPNVVGAFERILANDTDRVLRMRAAIFLTGLELPRIDGRLTRQLVEQRAARVVELAAVSG
jgi:hypothetical protein